MSSSSISSDISIYKKNLDKSLEVNETLKRNNELIRKKYNELKEENNDLASKVTDLQSSLTLAYQSKEAIERDCESLYKQWNEHVKQQQDEFQQIQSQMVPSRELEMLRITMAEELETSYKKMNDINNELIKMRNLYHVENRNLELLTIEYNQYKKNIQQTIATNQANYQHEISTLKLKNSELTDLIDDTTTIDELRQVQRANADLLYREKAAKKNLSIKEDDYQQLIINFDQYKINNHKKMKENQSKYISLQQDNIALQKN